jgi:hypothetical protein
MKDACAKAKSKQFPNPKSAPVRHLRFIAMTFVDLQQDRHTADYDNSKKWTRTEVLAQIEAVQAAFDSWQAISGEEIAEDFLLQLLVQK